MEIATTIFTYKIFKIFRKIENKLISKLDPTWLFSLILFCFFVVRNEKPLLTLYFTFNLNFKTLASKIRNVCCFSRTEIAPEFKLRHRRSVSVSSFTATFQENSRNLCCQKWNSDIIVRPTIRTSVSNPCKKTSSWWLTSLKIFSVNDRAL